MGIMLDDDAGEHRFLEDDSVLVVFTYFCSSFLLSLRMGVFRFEMAEPFKEDQIKRFTLVSTIKSFRLVELESFCYVFSLISSMNTTH